MFTFPCTGAVWLKLSGPVVNGNGGDSDSSIERFATSEPGSDKSKLILFKVTFSSCSDPEKATGTFYNGIHPTVKFQFNIKQGF